MDTLAADPYELYESNVRAYCRTIGIEWARAKNALLFTPDGDEYTDFLSGCGSLNYGHNDDDMKSALMDYISNDGIALSLDLHTESKRDFIATFVERILAPRGLDYKIQFTGPTGTNAVEAALKLARKVTGRTNVIAFTNGFHGVSLGALAVTGSAYHRSAAGCGLSEVSRLPYDGYLGNAVDTADQLERMLADPSSGVARPAAIILETVQGEGGLNTASYEWMGRIRRLANAYGALLIVDDIQAGCGRTGEFFSFECMGLAPDIVVLAKSLSGFGLPLSVVLVRRDYDVWEPAQHNGTFRGNNHAFVTAAAAIRKFWSSGEFAATVRARAAIMEAWAGAIAGQSGWLSKGRGMMRGLRCPSKQVAEDIRRGAQLSGLILETCGPNDEVVKLMPPLTIEEDLLTDALSRLTRVIEPLLP
ncbi:MAG: diaminobutyrate/2-oxoglutarate aminotransferase [Gammaproteobacteria bacterium]|nr:diaminobutyrate/2-oxoglutarate aminotransferase [Gammaproteobacteria bacterium]